MLLLAKENGSGKADANSYADRADGDAYHEGHLDATAWTGASEADRGKALVMATRVVDAMFSFLGTKCTAARLSGGRGSAECRVGCVIAATGAKYFFGLDSVVLENP